MDCPLGNTGCDW